MGRYETLYEDADYLMDEHLRDRNREEDWKVSFPRVDPDNKKFKPSADLLDEFYSLISRDSFRQLLELYRDDYRMFGYEEPSFNFNSTNK